MNVQRIRRFLRLERAVAGIVLASIAIACSSSTAAPDRLCTPNANVYCRCQDRQEGTKTCSSDGASFGACIPCESATNPQVTTTSGTEPPSGADGGKGDSDAQTDGGGSLCGNGIVDPGEDCDDRNAVDTDGCTSGCKLSDSYPASVVACPGIEVNVWGGNHKPVTLGSTTSSGNRDCTPTCTGQIGNSSTGAAANDRIFKVIAHKTGTLNVSVSDANYDVFLYASASCSDTVSIQQFACKNATDENQGEALSFPVTAGQTYYVYVDGAGLSANTGSFRASFQIP